MIRILLSLSILLLSLGTEAKDAPRYPVSAIPETLKAGAHAVVREDLVYFTIHTRSTASLHVRMVVTIFNDHGKHYAKHAIWYDRLRKITSIKGEVLNAAGEVIRKLKSNEITDHSAFEGLFSDNRAKIVDLTQARYPYTVDIAYDVDYKFLYDITGSVINAAENVSVQYAAYKLNFPENLKPRYKTYNITEEPEYESNSGRISLTWTFENLPARKFEAYSNKRQVIKRIDAAPTAFEFDGYAGSMESWDEYGRWIATLNAGRNVLPEETRNKIAHMLSGLETVEEKVRVLYEFLQNKTRYVSIQLGIGGYQPFEASLVDKTGYGDCKALSNYMLSMLEVAGIKGHYALILAGEQMPEIETDFPRSQFNHAIVAVPNGADTIWLECTSQTNPFGYQGSFTGDRKALLITDTGAKLVHTTRYPAAVNIQTTSAEVTIDRAGAARAEVRRTYSGLQYETRGLNFVVGGPYEEQKRWIQNNFDIPSFNVASFSIQNVRNKIPVAVISAQLAMNRFATASGQRLFLTPNLMNRNTFVPEKVGKRETEIVRRMAYIDFDTIRYKLPEDIYPEFLPENVQLRSRFGQYEASFTVDQGQLVYVRKLQINKGIFPPESYQEMIDFFRAVSKADHAKLVFISKT